MVSIFDLVREKRGELLEKERSKLEKQKEPAAE